MNRRSITRKQALILTVTLGVLIAAGFGALAAAPVQAQQPPEDAEYIGARDCLSCHRDLRDSHASAAHTLALQDPSDSETAIIADFSTGDEVRTIQLPGEDAPRAFTADDVALVVGSGIHIQRYLYKTEGGYLVLPAEWNTAEQKWQTYTLADQWPDAAYDWGANCAGCHTTGLDTSSYSWEEEGVQCEACHGPGSAHADAADDAGGSINDEEMAAILAAISPATDPQICGSCHSAGSEDGNAYPTDFRPGQTLVDGYQLVMPDDSAHWRSSGHAAMQNMQYNEWNQSGHASALTTMLGSDYAAESCLQCHSGDYVQTEVLIANHTDDDDLPLPDPITLDTAQYGVTCTTCHTLHGDTDQPSLLVESPDTLCMDCHQDAGRSDEIHHPAVEMFTGAQIIDQVPGVASNHLNAGATCVKCHMPPSLETGDTWYSPSHLLMPAFPGDVEDGQPDSCTTCHTDLSPEYLQEFIDKIQTKVSDRLSNAQIAIDSREDIPDWVHDALDFVAGDGSLGVHNYAYTTQLLDSVEVQLGITTVVVPDTIPIHEIEDPQDCAECHADEHREWQNSPHANASLSQAFQEKYAADGQPSYCMSCHASGYDPRSEQYVFEGVVCSNCHYTTAGVSHPPGPVEIATDSQVCGRCHSGEHSPTYNEWLVSAHSEVGIDCVDCHTPHDNGLILDNVNDTCGSCHQEALVDKIHMGDDMTCVDCHMARIANDNGVQVVSTGHSMNIDPTVCASCHGNTHLLSDEGARLDTSAQEHIAQMEAQVAELEDTANQNLNSGIVGGALGALVLVLIVFLTIRLGRLK